MTRTPLDVVEPAIGPVVYEVAVTDGTLVMTTTPDEVVEPATGPVV